MKPTYRYGLLVWLAVSVFMISCSPKATQPLSRLDTPEHHVFAGAVLLNQEKYADAGREFELALRLDPLHSRARTGLGLVKAYGGDFEGGFDAIKKAGQVAQTGEERLFALVGAIRVNTLSHASCLKIGIECRPDGAWLRRSEEAFNQALLINPQDASVHYFMGECYLAALDLESTGRMFMRVLDLNAGYTGEAGRGLRLVEKIRRARPETVTAKKAALAQRLTRAEVAALFVEEMKIVSLLASPRPDVHPGDRKDRGNTGLAVALRTPATDIAGHPLRPYIERIVDRGVKGLDLFPDGTFRPDELVDRASYAAMIADILIKAAGDPALATRFVGSPSPFIDLREDLPYYNAVMVVTSRGIMDPKNAQAGLFLPLGPLSGTDALLVIRNIEKELRH